MLISTTKKRSEQQCQSDFWLGIGVFSLFCIQGAGCAGTKGSGYCASTIRMRGSTWQGNSAQQGGAIYATEGCRLIVSDTAFDSNHAQVYMV